MWCAILLLMTDFSLHPDAPRPTRPGYHASILLALRALNPAWHCQAYCLWVLAVIALVVVPLFATFAADNVWVKDCIFIWVQSLFHTLLIA